MRTHNTLQPTPEPPTQMETVHDWRQWCAYRSHLLNNPLTVPPAPALNGSAAERAAYRAACIGLIWNLPVLQLARVNQVQGYMQAVATEGLVRREPGVRQGVVLSAPTNSGKTTLARDFGLWLETQLQNPNPLLPIRRGRAVADAVPVVFVRAPAKISLRSLCQNIVQFYGERVRSRETEASLTQRVHALVRDCDTRFMFIDDISRVLTRGQVTDEAAVNLLRELQETSVTMVLLGIALEDSPLMSALNAPSAATVAQIHERFDLLTMEPFSADPELLPQWFEYLDMMQVALSFLDWTRGDLRAHAPLLLSASEGNLGSANRLICQAAVDALSRSGGAVIDDSGLRRVIERRGRTARLTPTEPPTPTANSRRRRGSNATYTQRAS